jgi:hypothetical protein
MGQIKPFIMEYHKSIDGLIFHLNPFTMGKLLMEYQKMNDLGLSPASGDVPMKPMPPPPIDVPIHTGASPSRT